MLGIASGSIRQTDRRGDLSGEPYPMSSHQSVGVGMAMGIGVRLAVVSGTILWIYKTWKWYPGPTSLPTLGIFTGPSPRVY